MNPREHREEIIRWAKEENLVVGFAPVPADLKAEYFTKWIAEEKHAQMGWMDNYKRIVPRAILPEARSVVVLGMNYFQNTHADISSLASGPSTNSLRSLLRVCDAGASAAVPEGHGGEAPEINPLPEGGTRGGQIAMYAQGDDYHNLFLKKLKKLCTVMQRWGGAQKPYVDTGPILEKRFAAATTLGWQGKNTLLISPTHGPWLFLGVILTTLELPADKPTPNRCGSCTRCMTACPTGAIVAPYQLDARRCIAYWTIEHKGEIPEEFHKAIGDRLYGCDDCLTACPWNKFAKESNEIKLKARDYPSAEKILEMTEAEFLTTFAGSPIKRLGLERLKRNARIVVGNSIEKRQA